MTMNTVKVCILGLGRVGASVALALQRYNGRKDARQRFAVTGYDPRDGTASTAQKRGAYERGSRSVENAVVNQDLIVIAMPYAEVRATYARIASALRADSVVLDLSLVKQPSLAWAKEYLAGRAHMIGIAPVLNPRYLFDGLDDAEHAADDLFDGGVMLLTPDSEAVREAVELAVDFCSILGGAPHFVDPIEYDGLSALTEGLPALLGVAAFYMLKRNVGWRDARRSGNPSLGQLTHHLLDTHPDDLRDMLLENRENIARAVDSMIQVLAEFQSLLERSDRAGLEAVLIDSSDAYAQWLSQRTSGKWEANTDSPDGGGSVVSSLLGSYLTRKLGGDKRDT